MFSTKFCGVKISVYIKLRECDYLRLRESIENMRDIMAD